MTRVDWNGEVRGHSRSKLLGRAERLPFASSVLFQDLRVLCRLLLHVFSSIVVHGGQGRREETRNAPDC